MVRSSHLHTQLINQNNGIVQSMRVEDTRDEEMALLDQEERDKQQLHQSPPQPNPEASDDLLKNAAHAEGNNPWIPIEASPSRNSPYPSADSSASSMDFYYSPNLPDESYYYDYNQIPYDGGYHESYYYAPEPVQSSVSFSNYELYPAQPLVAYSAWPESYSDSVSTEYVVHYSVAEADEDLNFVEYDLHPFGGGYDIVQTYGKPLPPDEEICYPRSSSPMKPASASPVKPPQPEKVEGPKAVTQPTVDEQGKEVLTEDEEEDFTEDEEEVDTEEDDDEGEDESNDGEPYDEYDEKSAGSVQVYGGVDPPTVGQVPAGYGLEAFDLCENLFGYWPCLSKRVNKKKCCSCGRDIVSVEEDGDKWKRTADYLFGGPDPYRGWADQSAYAYQMQYQQPPSTLYYQPDQYAQISWSE